MSKFKIEHNAGKSLLVIQGQKGQQISEREYYAISTGQVSGLLRAEVVKKSSSFKINYNISGYISLREFLFNPLNKQSFAKLLSNILNNLKSLQNSFFNYQYILMDMNAAMVNPATQEVSFVYVPITFYDSGTNLKTFLLSIIECCSFMPGEDTAYVREYIRILNSGINFSVFDLEEYITGLKMGDQFGGNIKKCTRCGAIVQPNVSFCSSCGMKIGGLIMNNPQGVYDPLKNVSAQNSVKPIEPNDPILCHEPGETGGCFNGRESPLAKSEPPAAQMAVIYRSKTGEQISIHSTSFRMGKDPYNCEYCVSDNPAISRCHAVIKQLNGKWFLTDLNSTNRSYMEERVLQPNVEQELYNGVTFKLANEKFIFYLY